MMLDQSLDDLLAALADPARRGVIDLLRQKPHRAGELAAELALSPARMSQHLRVLRQSGLIEDDSVNQDARVKLYRLCPRPFSLLRGWLAEIDSSVSLSGQRPRGHDAEMPAGPRLRPSGRHARQASHAARPQGPARQEDTSVFGSGSETPTGKELAMDPSDSRALSSPQQAEQSQSGSHSVGSAAARLSGIKRRLPLLAAVVNETAVAVLSSAASHAGGENSGERASVRAKHSRSGTQTPKRAVRSNRSSVKGRTARRSRRA